MDFSKFINKYILIGEIENTAPIHIGSNKDNFDPIEVDNSIIRYASDLKPFIPGSSFKGVLRSYIESIFSTGINGFRSCSVTSEYSCSSINKEKIKNLREKDSKVYFDSLYNLLCDTCKIFGSENMASKIYIRDLKLKSDKYFITKRDGVAIDRDTLTASRNKKYDFEVLEPGAIFDLYITFENLEEKYQPVIKLIINALKNQEILIGGKTSRGLGTIKLKNVEIYKIDSSNVEKYLINGFTEEMRWAYNV
ncbi:CRISPR-associated RAMP protein Csx7 [Caldicellulosiruptoraceae bacterium PP1]